MENIVFACEANNNRLSILECPYTEHEELSIEYDESFVILSYAYSLMGAFVSVMCIRRLHAVREIKWFLMLSIISGISLGEQYGQCILLE